MSKKAKSVDDLFSEEPQDAPVDVSSLFESPTSGPDLKKARVGNLRPLGEMMMSVPIGAAQGATLGYANRALPQSAIDMAERNPVFSGFGKILGGLAPGMGVAKGVGAIGRAVPYMSALSKPGLISGAVEGAVLGGAQDPGNAGDRSTNAMIGAGIGAPIGLIAKILGTAGKNAKTYDEINNPDFNYSQKVKDELESAVSSMMQKEVAPRQQQIKVLLNDKSVELNPDLLRRFQRDALTGPPRKKGGLDKLASILERKQQESGSRDVGANTAQRIKQYLDSISDYNKQKPYSDTATATHEKAKYAADVLRNKLRNVSPEYGKLNAPMENALSIKNTLRATSDQSPMTTVSSDVMSDKGQLIQELDRLAGSSLGETGGSIRDAKELRSKVISLFRPLESSATIYKRGMLGAGRASNAVNKATPAGTRQSTLSAILQSLRNDEEEQQ